MLYICLKQISSTSNDQNWEMEQIKVYVELLHFAKYP